VVSNAHDRCQERAAAYGIEPDELEEHHPPADHPRRQHSPGEEHRHVLNVDGGVPAAYPR